MAGAEFPFALTETADAHDCGAHFRDSVMVAAIAHPSRNGTTTCLRDRMTRGRSVDRRHHGDRASDKLVVLVM
jgi:hypothetical protein